MAEVTEWPYAPTGVGRGQVRTSNYQGIHQQNCCLFLTIYFIALILMNTDIATRAC